MSSLGKIHWRVLGHLKATESETEAHILCVILERPGENTPIQERIGKYNTEVLISFPGKEWRCQQAAFSNPLQGEQTQELPQGQNLSLGSKEGLP